MACAHGLSAGLWAVGGVAFLSASSALADGQFKRFPETISPNGAYVLAWGPSSDPSPNTAELTEVPYEDEAFDETSGDNDVNNYLVDVATKKIVATIPGFGYFCGPKWRKNRADLYVSWSTDSQRALAICDGRWGSEAVVWIAPQTGKIVDVQKQLEKGFYSVLRKHEPSFHEVDVLFSEAATPKPDLLVVHASGTIPKEKDTADYLLKFKIAGEGDKIQFHLLSGRKLPEETAGNNQDREVELNKVYNNIRAKLTQKERDVLRDEQASWLKLRESMPDEGTQLRFTERRTAELRTRLEINK